MSGILSYQRILRIKANPNLNVKANPASLPNILSHSTEGAAGFDDSVADYFSVNGGFAREGAPHIDEVIHRLQFLALHCGVRFQVGLSRGRLEHHLGLLNADGQPKVCEKMMKSFPLETASLTLGRRSEHNRPQRGSL